MARTLLNLSEEVGSWPSWASGAVLIGAGTSTPTTVAPGSSGNVLTSNGSTWSSQPPSGGGSYTPGITATATSGGTTTLTSSSHQIQVFTGTAAQTVVLPTTSIVAGSQWMIINQSTGAITVTASGGATVLVLAASTSATFSAAVATPTLATDWDSQYGGVAVASGKVLSVNNSLTLQASGGDGETFDFDAIPNTKLTGWVSNIADTTASATQVLAGQLTIPANSTAVGDTYRLNTFGNNSGAGTVSYVVRVGTGAASTDAAVCTVTPYTISGTHLSALATLRTIGASGTCYGSGAGFGMGTTTAQLIKTVSITTGSAVVNTQVQNYLSLWIASSAGTHTNRTAYLTLAGA